MERKTEIGSGKFSAWKTAVAAVATLLLAFLVIPASANAAGAGKKPSVLFLISEDPDNYEADKTIPPYAEELQRTQGFQTKVIKGEGPLTAFSYPGLLPALAETDLVVFYARRIALSHEQLNAIKDYLKAGRPMVALRTANHGFAPRGKIAEGHAGWPEYVADILGCENRGYGTIKDGIQISAVPAAAGHPILKGVPEKWFSPTNIYLVAPLLDKSATVLLAGAVPNKIVEPLAWTRMAGKSRIFYTSLGHPKDFDFPQFHTLLTNGIRWALADKAK